MHGIMTLGLVLSLAFAGAAWAQAKYSFKSLKISAGPFDTFVASSNDFGSVIGRWQGRDGNPASGHFRWRKNTFHPLTLPGLDVKAFTGVGDGGWLVGFYLDWLDLGDAGSVQILRGFRLQGATMTPLDVPDHHGATVPWGVNALGHIVGHYATSQTNSAGFLWRDGTFQTVSYPGAWEMSLTGINDHGEMVGWVFGDGGYHGLWVGVDGVPVLYDMPGSAGTAFRGLNNAGQVVGEVWLIGAGFSHAFLLEDGRVTLLDPVPGRESSARDIDNPGVIVGITTRLGDAYTQGWIGRPR